MAQFFTRNSACFSNAYRKISSYFGKNRRKKFEPLLFRDILLRLSQADTSHQPYPAKSVNAHFYDGSQHIMSGVEQNTLFSKGTISLHSF